MYFSILRPYSFLTGSQVFLRRGSLVFPVFFFAIALYLSLWIAPADFQQGENYRIIYVHVPAAWMSLLIYILISICSLFFLITKHPILNLVSQVSAKMGSIFTIITLSSGCLWGKPMWGAFWVWDARLTSVLILFFIYLGAIRLCQISAETGSIFICVGLLNIPIIKFSVNWWNTLHQPSSITQFGTSIHVSMLFPILFMFLAFFFLFLILVLLDTRKHILNSTMLRGRGSLKETKYQSDYKLDSRNKSINGAERPS